MSHTASVTLEKMRPRARAAVEALELHYRAVFVQTLAQQKASPTPKRPDEYPPLGKGRKPVAERLLDLSKEANRKQRRILLKHMMTAPIAGRAITARERDQLEKWAKADTKTPMAERTGIGKQLADILEPAGGWDIKDPREITDWEQGILRDMVPGIKPYDDGRDDDAEPGEPTGDDDEPLMDGQLYPNAPITPELHFKVNRVRCITDTSEWGRDEITYGGLALHGDLDRTATPPLDGAVLMRRVDAGQFTGGDVADMTGDDPLHVFDLNGITTPHGFFAIFSMVETDPGAGYTQYLEDLMLDLNAEVTTFWNQIVGWTIGSTVGIGGAGLLHGPLFPVFVLVGFVYGLLAGIYFAYQLDDIFPPTVEYLQLVDNAIAQPPFNGNLVSEEQTLLTGDFGGLYEVDYVWELIQTSPGSPGDQDSDVPDDA